MRKEGLRIEYVTIFTRTRNGQQKHGIEPLRIKIVQQEREIRGVRIWA